MLVEERARQGYRIVQLTKGGAVPKEDGDLSRFPRNFHFRVLAPRERAAFSSGKKERGELSFSYVVD